MTDGPTRVCLLTHGETLPAWAASAVRRMLAETDAELSLVVEDTSSQERTALEALRRVFDLGAWGVVAAALTVFADDLNALEARPVRELPGADNADWIACEPVPVDGWKTRIPKPDVDRMAETDVAVRFGFGFLVGDALDAPSMGVLSFHHGDIRSYRGQPMGFWEYVHGEATAGVTLQRIDETLDGGEVVAERRVSIGDAPTWVEVRRRLLAASEPMLAAGIRCLVSHHSKPETVPADELGDLYTFPTGRPILTYLRKTASGVGATEGERE